MKLIELCEPLFSYICRLNRSARKGGSHSHDPVRSDLKALLNEMQAKARTDAGLSAHMDKARGGIHLVLLFFVDFMIRNSALSFAMGWQDLAAEEHELAGEEKFFQMLDQDLQDKSEAASERIAIYYTCMGLGFTGFHTGQPEYLRRKMLECSSRLRAQVNADESAPVCPEAYNADTRILFTPIKSRLVGMTIAVVVMLAAVVVINVYQYIEKSKELTRTLEQIDKKGDSAPQSSPSTPPGNRTTLAPDSTSRAG